MSKLSYPLFLRDADNYFCGPVTSQKSLNSQIEENDAEEYTGWDRSGRPVVLKWQDGGVSAQIASDSDERAELIEAILDFARRYCSPRMEINPSLKSDPESLLVWTIEAAEEYRRSKTIVARLKRWFRGKEVQ
jgi:hypothetical protein